MKNLLLLCVLFFAFQSSLFTQNDFGIVVGYGIYNQDVVSDTKSKFTLQIKAGFSYQRNIINNRLQLSASLNSHYFLGTTRGYSNTLAEYSVLGGNLNTYNPYNVRNKSYFAVTLPIILSVNWNKFSFGGGSEFQYRTVNSNLSIGYVGSIQYRTSERFCINLNFVRSLTDDSYFNVSQLKTRTQRIEASFRYRLSQK